jgi:gamma-glutamyltranspeptidase/glutathione hydrolase
LAKHGIRITALQHKLLSRELDNFNKVESRSGTRYFYKNDTPYEPGELFTQSDLAATLTRIADKGVQEFYRGGIARQIDADMRENGGLLRMDDLALIPFPIEREPLVGTFRELDLYTMPPPGSGRSLLFALMMLDLVPNTLKMNDPLKEYLLFIHILRKTLLERSDRPYDPNFFQQTQHEEDMLDPLYARECLLEILSDVDRSVLPFIPTEDELTGETTHLSVIDKNGVAVSLTQSIERVYGSKAAAAGLGFLYNNYLYDFEYVLPEHPFYLRPNAVPWATVAPSLVFHNNDLWMVLGSPGSERIISTLARFLLNMVDNRMSLSEAMLAPRLHCSLGGRVSLEGGRFPESLFPFLEYKNFRIDKREDFSFYLGCVQAILKQQDGGFQAVADVRRDGAAVGA